MACDQANLVAAASQPAEMPESHFPERAEAKPTQNSVGQPTRKGPGKRTASQL